VRVKSQLSVLFQKLRSITTRTAVDTVHLLTAATLRAIAAAAVAATAPAVVTTIVVVQG
jgi:hypothetical protein